MALILYETLSNELWDLTREVRELLKTNPEIEEAKLKELTEKHVRELEKRVEIRIQQEREDVEAERDAKEEALALERSNADVKAKLKVVYNVRILILDETHSGKPEDISLTREIVEKLSSSVHNTFYYNQFRSILTKAKEHDLAFEQVVLRKVDAFEEIPDDLFFTGYTTEYSYQLAKYRTNWCIIIPASMKRFAAYLTKKIPYTWEDFVLSFLCDEATFTMEGIVDLLALDLSDKKPLVRLRSVAQALRFKSIPRRRILQMIVEKVFISDLTIRVVRQAFKQDLAELEAKEEDEEEESEENEEDPMEDAKEDGDETGIQGQTETVE